MENESVVGNNDNLIHQNQQDRRENRDAKLKRDAIAINLFNNIPHHYNMYCFKKSILYIETWLGIRDFRISFRQNVYMR